MLSFGGFLKQKKMEDKHPERFVKGHVKFRGFSRGQVR